MVTERKRSRGRPAKTLDPTASQLAALGARLRTLRTVRELTLAQLAVMTGYSHQHLGAVERGSVAPSEAVVEVCDSVLGAGGALVGMLPGVIREQAHLRHCADVARRDEGLDWDRLWACADWSSAVTAAVVEDVETITVRQRHLYHALTSAQMLAPVDGHMGLLLSLLDRPLTGPLRRRLAAATAEAAGFAAWIWFDLGDHYKMAGRYETAMAAMGDAADPGLMAYISAYKAVTADMTGRTDDAVQTSEQALGVAGRHVQPITRAWLHAVHATMAARTGDRRSALADLGHAHTELESAGTEHDPWMYDFDFGRLLGYEGTCHLELGHFREAARCFEEARAFIPALCVRRRAELGLDLAFALLAQDEGGEAVRLAQDAITVFLGRSSSAGLSRIKTFRQHLARQGRTAEGRDLDEFVRALRS